MEMGGHAHTVQLNLNFTHACWYMRVPSRFTHVKFYNLACNSYFARRFVMRTLAIKHLWCTRRAPHKQIHHERTSSKPCMKDTWCTTR